MKALYFSEHGTTENLKFGDVAEPRPGPDEVVVRVRACALNHLDLWVLRGWPGLKLSMPHIGGADIAGEIHELGVGVTGFATGERVVVNPGHSTIDDEWSARGEESLSPGYRIIGEGRQGGFAELVTVPAKSCRPMPGTDFVEAAAPLLVGLTSWRMITRRAQLQKGETVLIVGAGGGVNSFSIMLCKALGARVIALTSTEEKNRKAKELGAESVIDYRKVPDWSREVRRLTDGRGADIIIDNVGAATFAQSMSAAARGGRIVTVGNTSGPNVSFDNRLIFVKQLSLLGSTMGSEQDFDEFLAYIKLNKIRPIVDSVIDLADGRKGYELLERGEMFGKVVLRCS